MEGEHIVRMIYFSRLLLREPSRQDYLLNYCYAFEVAMPQVLLNEKRGGKEKSRFPLCFAWSVRRSKSRVVV
jgi:hypothetical protein